MIREYDLSDLIINLVNNMEKFHDFIVGSPLYGHTNDLDCEPEFVALKNSVEEFREYLILNSSD